MSDNCNFCGRGSLQVMGGMPGPRGNQGVRGSQWFAVEGIPSPTASGILAGDWAVNTQAEPQILYRYNGTAWIIQGTLTGGGGATVFGAFDSNQAAQDGGVPVGGLFETTQVNEWSLPANVIMVRK